MNEILSNPVVQRVGWALVHFLWQGAAVAGLLAVALALLAKRTPQARWLAACVALGLMAALPVVTACLVPVEVQATAPIAPPGKTLAVAQASPSAVPVAPLPGAHGLAAPGAALPEMAGPAENQSAGPAPAGASLAQQAQDFLRPVLPWCLLVWLAGVGAMSLWHLGGWVLLKQTRREGTRPVSEAIGDMVSALSRRLGVRRTVRVLKSARVKVPVVIGWLAPVILLPGSVLTGLTPSQLKAVLAHELAHIRRYDELVRLVQAAVETLLFYHPAVWWVSSRIRQESEHCCDEIAIAAHGDRRGYAQTLGRIAELGRQAPRLAVAASGGKLLPRIRRILGLSNDYSRPGRGWMIGLVGMACLIAAGAVIYGCVAVGHAEQGSSATKSSTQPATAPAPTGDTAARKFEKWEYKLTVDTKPARVKYAGMLAYGGKELTASDGQWLWTPWGKLTYVIGERDRGWMPHEYPERLPKGQEIRSPDPKLSERVAQWHKALCESLDRFTLMLDYHGEQDKPFSRLLLTTQQEPSVASPLTLVARISPEQARKIVDRLTEDGVLAEAGNEAFLDIAPPKGPCYVLTILGCSKVEPYLDLGWDLKMLQRLDSLEAVLSGPAKGKMNTLLGRMSGLRKEWAMQAAIWEGTVVDPEGKPAGGAQVALASPADKVRIDSVRISANTSAPLNCATTDPAGRFTLRGDGRDHTIVIAHSKGFAEVPPDDLAAGKPLQLRPWCKVDARLLLGDRPGGGWEIWVNSYGPIRTGRTSVETAASEATTGADGKCRVNYLLPGKAIVQVAGKTASVMGTAASITVQADKATAVTLGGMGRPVVGKLVGKVPVDWSGFQLRLLLLAPHVGLPGDDQSWAVWQKFIASYQKKLYSRDVAIRPDGSFRIDNVPQGTYQLIVFGKTLADTQALRSGVLGISVPGHGQFTVDPMPGGQSDQPLDVSAIAETSATKTADGEGAVYVTTEAGGGQKPGEQRFGWRRPKGTSSIEGTIVSEKDGKPVAGAMAYLFAGQTNDAIFYITGKDGAFIFKDIPGGAYSLQGSCNGFQKADYDPKGVGGMFPKFEIKAGEHVRGVALKLKKAYRIAGKILGADGKPLAKRDGIYALAWGSQNDPKLLKRGTKFRIVTQAWVAPDGSFTLDGLDGGPVYVMGIDFASYKQDQPRGPSYYGDTFDRAKAKVIEPAKEGKDTITGVEIRMRDKGGLVLEGTITEKGTGKPIAKALVVAHHADMLFDSATAYTDKDGRYRLECLGGGKLTVHVDATPWNLVRQRKEITLQGAGKPSKLDFELSPGVRITGTFVDAAGKMAKIVPASAGGIAYVRDPNAATESYAMSGLRNRHGPKRLSSGGTSFTLGHGEYLSAEMFFPTDGTFEILGQMSGDIGIGFNPMTAGQAVREIRYKSKDIFKSGLSAKAGQEIEDVTIVLGATPATGPATQAASGDTAEGGKTGRATEGTLTAGDVIDITVSGLFTPDKETVMRRQVPLNGYVDVATLKKKVRAAGLTVEELKKSLSGLLGKRTEVHLVRTADLAPGDVIDVTVLGMFEPDLETLLRRQIYPDGHIDLPRLAKVKAAGLPADKLGDSISKAYDGKKATVTRVKTADLAPGDVIDVTVLGMFEPDLETLVRRQIATDGQIDLPRLKARVKAAGFTADALADSIGRIYGGKQAWVVRVKESRAPTSLPATGPASGPATTRTSDARKTGSDALPGGADAAADVVRFMGLPDDETQKLPNSGVPNITKVEVATYEDYLAYKKEGSIVREERHGRWLYWARHMRVDVEVAPGRTGWFTITERFKSEVPATPATLSTPRLHSGQANSGRAGPADGAKVLAVVLNDANSGRDCYLDLDTGKVYSKSAKDAGNEAAFFPANGIDLTVYPGRPADGIRGPMAGERGVVGPCSIDLKARVVGAELWNASEAKIADEAKKELAPSVAFVAVKGSSLPPTFVFRTREGGVGIMQVLDVRNDAEPRSVKIAYKMVRTAPGTQPASQPDQRGFPPLDRDKKVAINRVDGDNRLVVYSFGDQLERLGPDVHYAFGTSIELFNRNAGKTVFEAGCGEADGGIVIDCQGAGRGVYRFTDCTWDPRSAKPWVPFIETTVSVDPAGAAKESRRIVLAADKATPQAIEKLVERGLKVLSGHESDRDEGFETVLGHLRNMAVDDPGPILKALARFRGKTGDHLSEVLSNAKGEVEAIAELRPKPATAPATEPSGSGR